MHRSHLHGSTLGSSVIKVTYGLDVARSNDKYLSTLERGMEGFALLAHEYTPLFEVFPKLAQIPTWLPGTMFLRHLASARRATYALRDVPWRAAKYAIVSFRHIIAPFAHTNSFFPGSG